MQSMRLSVERLWPSNRIAAGVETRGKTAIILLFDLKYWTLPIATNPG